MRVPIINSIPSTTTSISGSGNGRRGQASSPQQDLSSFVHAHRVDLTKYEAIRRELHADPELSEVEEQTGEYIAKKLRKLGFDDVHTGIGGFGVAAVLRNGEGPTVLLRSDTDALPVKERTGLDYASTKTMRDAAGVEQPVMHACGHDVHMTCLLAAAETLVATRAAWSGTLELVFQPAEERLAGALAMVDDGLYERYIPEPDVVLGQHVFPGKAGTLGGRSGPFFAATDSFKITFHGRGAHASQPQDSVDPVVMATAAVQRLQGIVAREVAPADTAVVTVAAIHAGEAENIIVDDAFIRVNVRTFRPEVRDIVLAAIERIVRAEAQASGAPQEPTIEKTTKGPATVNDADIHKRLSKAFLHHFGADAFDPDLDAVMGSEDFGILATAIGKPSYYWIFGGTDPDKWDEAARKGKLKEIPSNHSALFAPVMQPTLKTGVDALTTAALTYLAKSS